MQQKEQNEEKILVHKRSSNFITDYVDRFTITGAQSQNGLSITLGFGRDVVEVKHEKLIPSGDGKFSSQISEDCIETYRLQLASFQVSLEAAKSLVTALNSMIESAPSAEGQEQS